MNFSQFFWKSDASFMGNSLRFRGAQHLEYPGWPNRISNIYLDSFWVKRSLLTSVQTITSTEAGSSPGDQSFDADNKFTARSVQGARPSNKVFDDTSAWYHICYKTTGSSANQAGILWVNGLPDKTNMTFSTRRNENTPVAIGMRLGTSQPYYFEGLVADFHRIRDVEGVDPVGTIDGNDFGEFNPQGIWVPKNYMGTYGSTGFRLDFKDPNNVGEDHSGNGFDFIPSDFDLNPASPTYDLDPDNPVTNLTRA